MELEEHAVLLVREGGHELDESHDLHHLVVGSGDGVLEGGGEQLAADIHAGEELADQLVDVA